MTMKDRFWPTARVHASRPKAAIEVPNIRSVERSSNWCYRPQPAVHRLGKHAVAAAALLSEAEGRKLGVLARAVALFDNKLVQYFGH
jgi:hypothetical protein